MTTHRDRLPIPYPLEVPDSVVADRAGFALAIRGMGLSDDGLSFSVHILTTLLGHPRKGQAMLDTAWPFCGAHRESDPDGLSVRCQWRYPNTSEWDSDAILLKSAETPVLGGFWNWNSPELAEGHYNLRYPLNAATAEEINISLSWTALGFDPETVRIDREAIDSALQQKPR
ncbi:hypothetical protein [Arthrobacter russicus]|uniref:Uncharacterized protein n=2 Tax=Bacillati TaxID=1783272 RepID=A0ABU1JBX8_9MICC|nr:hypothetical protein [Arthrobacter russicus]MDR6269914.1 hypothetical protein [Arthrobacter russicus]